MRSTTSLTTVVDALVAFQKSHDEAAALHLEIDRAHEEAVMEAEAARSEEALKVHRGMQNSFSDTKVAFKNWNKKD